MAEIDCVMAEHLRTEAGDSRLGPQGRAMLAKSGVGVLRSLALAVEVAGEVLHGAYVLL